MIHLRVLFKYAVLLQGGELFDKIIEKSRLAEAEAKVYFYQGKSPVVFLRIIGNFVTKWRDGLS